MFAFESLDLFHANFFAQNLFDVGKKFPLVGANEGNRLAPGSGASRAPDAVDVVLGDVGEVEVDHVREQFDVEPPSGDVSGDKNPDPVCFEVS